MTTEPTTPPEPAKSETDKDAEIAKWKELARKNEDRAKSNADAAKELATLKESNKTAEDRLAALEKETADVRAEALRLRFAAKHGISDEDAALFLTGSDEETLGKQAARLATRNAEQTADTKKRGGTVTGEGKTPSKNPDADPGLREITRSIFGRS